MSSIKVKVVGNIIIIFLIIFATATTLVTCVEYLGISTTILKSLKERHVGIVPLHSTGYYKNAEISSDPYQNFIIQHLHPYYMFSLPWTTADRSLVDQTIVGLTSDGFRKNPSNSLEFTKNIVLLGGSTAFGHFSSSDANTFASKLSQLNKVNVVNRNAPSWNSHQELIALAKYSKTYDLSISFSLANDISVACAENNQWPDGQRYLDAPESFSILSSKINDIRGPSLTNNNSLKQFIRTIFPDTYKLLGWIKNFSSQYNNDTETLSNCVNFTEFDIADSFIRNQKAMSELSKARGAKHIIILQPQIELVNTDNPNFIFKNAVYETVYTSNLCKIAQCVDLRQTPFEVSLHTLFNGKNIKTALFVDNVHLTDRGVDKYSKIISQFINEL